ncbi:putative integrase/recombinase domain protein [Synechococcus sp. SYN20]|uniref:hypothetical protein n=1 Tax=Synechococcus sp. SYN20 TaxID=1050714 RepID=UPI00185F805B|nr:hypothetical protein [Synechococcus sp. SYN20]QNJ27246.1 putative integrase/recombinase domain protein [Synechococcus sp. SYN20]
MQFSGGGGGDKLLLRRFLDQCSRSGSKEAQDGYRRELRHFTRWRDQNHPHLHLRELDPALVQDWVSQLREQVEGGELLPLVSSHWETHQTTADAQTPGHRDVDQPAENWLGTLHVA